MFLVDTFERAAIGNAHRIVSDYCDANAIDKDGFDWFKLRNMVADTLCGRMTFESTSASNFDAMVANLI